MRMQAEPKPTPPLQKSDEEWRKILTPEQYRLLRKSGTERAGTGEYLKHNEAGVYRCAGCENELFRSDHKFESPGWPAFSEAAAKGSVVLRRDGFGQVEVSCARCGGHLGHLFKDGPTSSGDRY